MQNIWMNNFLLLIFKKHTLYKNLILPGIRKRKWTIIFTCNHTWVCWMECFEGLLRCLTFGWLVCFGPWSIRMRSFRYLRLLERARPSRGCPVLVFPLSCLLLRNSSPFSRRHFEGLFFVASSYWKHGVDRQRQKQCKGEENRMFVSFRKYSFESYSCDIFTKVGMDLQGSATHSCTLTIQYCSLSLPTIINSLNAKAKKKKMLLSAKKSLMARRQWGVGKDIGSRNWILGM